VGFQPTDGKLPFPLLETQGTIPDNWPAVLPEDIWEYGCGTCGLVSIANIHRLFGEPTTEDDVIAVARELDLFMEWLSVWVENIEILSKPNAYEETIRAIGSSSVADRKMILEYLNFRVEEPILCEDVSLNEIRQRIADGSGALINLNVNIFDPTQDDWHVVTLVKLDIVNDRPVGFWIQDTGEWGDQASIFISTKEYQKHWQASGESQPSFEFVTPEFLPPLPLVLKPNSTD